MLQGKGKKRAVGWFPASYVKLLGGEAAGKAGAAEEKPAGNEEAAGETQNNTALLYCTCLLTQSRR